MAQRYATDAEVLALAPELAGIAEPMRLAWLDITRCWLSPSVIGHCCSQAHAMLTAHALTTLPSGGPGGGGGAPTGPLSGEANGPASRSYATPPVGTTPGDAELATSAYGLMYISLSRTWKTRTSAVLMSRDPLFARGIRR